MNFIKIYAVSLALCVRRSAIYIVDIKLLVCVFFNAQTSESCDFKTISTVMLVVVCTVRYLLLT